MIWTRSTVGLETIKNRDASIELLGSEQGLGVSIGTPLRIFVVVINSGCDLLVLTKLVSGPVGVLRAVDDLGGSRGEGCNVLGKRGKRASGGEKAETQYSRNS